MIFFGILALFPSDPGEKFSMMKIMKMVLRYLV